MGAKRDLAEVLGSVDLFSRCSKGERRAVARHSETARLGAGTVLCREGDVGDAFFVILDGEVEVTVGGETANRLGPGDWFGELALLDGRPRSSTVTATTDVEVAVLGVRMFRTLLREVPDLATALLAGLAGALRAARQG